MSCVQWIIFASGVLCFEVSGLDLLVKTSQGLVRGIPSPNGDYNMFMGVPYAKVNSKNPFGNSLPYPSYEGILDANDDSVLCPQRNQFTHNLTGTLDCLNLHIYVPPSASPTNLKPVMVFIVGGKFKFGNPDRIFADPSLLVVHDVIVVVINYRMGVYGFMCLDTPAVPGNTGMKDQVAALHWMRENIGAFGGENDNITLFGCSSGASIVEYHLLSPASKGLFQKVIMQSGTVLNMWAKAQPVVTNNDTAIILAAELGFNATNGDDAIEFLSNVKPLDLIAAHERTNVVFRPCTEKTYDGINNFFKEHPEDILFSGNFESVPMIIGSTSEESNSLFVGWETQFSLLEQAYEGLYTTLAGDMNATKKQIDTIVKIATSFYTGDEINKEQIAPSIFACDSDFRYMHPTLRSLAFHQRNSNHPIFYYMFAYFGERNTLRTLQHSNTMRGVVHTDENTYLFLSHFLPKVINNEDRLMINRMTTMWSNFAKYSDPTPVATSLFPRWSPTTPGNREFLWIDSEPVMHKSPYNQRMAFWDLVYNVYGKYPPPFF